MRRFAQLFRRLDETNKTLAKVAALGEYFRDASPADAAWAAFFLIGRRIKRVVPTRELVAACLEVTELPEWLFAESYEAVGDLAETMALLLPGDDVGSDRPLADWIEARLLPLRKLSEAERRPLLQAAWGELDARQRFMWNKLLTGELRLGVSRGLVVRALAQVSGREPAAVEQILTGDWEPNAEFFERVLSAEAEERPASLPYPFCLAHPLQKDPASLGPSTDWLAEWKWDGIRAQLLRREDGTWLWSRGEELITHQFPELADDWERLPSGTVLDGEAVAWREGRVLPFADLQKRLNRKSPGKRMLADVPVRYIVFDLLEIENRDIRSEPLAVRRRQLAELFESSATGRLFGDDARIMLAASLPNASWEALARERDCCREQGVEGLMLKRLDGPYSIGRVTGVWWKWKVDPHTVDAVLIYAQRGSGRRAGLYTDYTFGVWDGDELVPFAKAYSGLSDQEIHEVDRFVREHTLERFGPVRSVEPQLVFELAFENIQRSTRHKSGIAVRFPRIARWRTDKQPRDADTLVTLKQMLPERREAR